MTYRYECGSGAAAYEMVNPADLSEKIGPNRKVNANHDTVPDNNMPFGGIRHADVGTYAGGPLAVTIDTSEHATYVDW
ncbi:MAG: hypothetical protein AAGA73_14355 [Pseudomonadota bacterium]